MCMRVILPVTALGCFHSLQQIVAGYLVGMPQRIFCPPKSHRKRINRSIQPASFEDFHKSQIHINIIIQTGKGIIPILDRMLIPGNGNIILNDSSQEFKLSRSPVTASQGLTRPGTFHFITQALLGQNHCFLSFMNGGSQIGYKEESHQEPYYISFRHTHFLFLYWLYHALYCSYRRRESGCPAIISVPGLFMIPIY